jgi:integrase/recombinase XerD
MSCEPVWFQKILDRHLHLPLSAERGEFLSHKLAQGNSWSSLRENGLYMAMAAQRLKLTSQTTLSPQEIDRAARRWAYRQPRPANVHFPDRVRQRFRSVVTSWFGFMNRLDLSDTPVDPHADLLGGFERFLLEERGLSPYTIQKDSYEARRFLQRHPLVRLKCHEGGAKELRAYVNHLQSHSSTRAGIASRLYSLRAFLRYAECRGLIAAGLSHAVTPPRIYSDERLPLGPSWADVQRLLKSADTKKPMDLRDRAIMLLLAVYGLRSAEVRHLELQDIDWDGHRLAVFRSKSRLKVAYPLVEDVAVAIRSYLQVRPVALSQTVFLRIQAPLKGLTSGGMHFIIRRRLQKLGISVPRRGPHCLRHACATHLRERGLSFKAIGDHLGHRSVDATRIYAKVDLAALREVANFDFGGLL